MPYVELKTKMGRRRPVVPLGPIPIKKSGIMPHIYRFSSALGTPSVWK